MNKCKNCGTEFEGKFCPECGEKWLEPVDPNAPHTCKKCGAVYEGKFCPECGTRFDADPKAAGATAQSAVAKAGETGSSDFKDTNVGSILGKVLRHLGYGLSLFLGLFTFLFLLGDLVNFGMFGESMNCYDAISKSGDTAITVELLLIIVLAIALLGAGVYHMVAVLFLEKKKNARYYVKNIPLVNLLSYIEAGIVFVYFVIGCALLGYVNSISSPFGSAGSGASCCLAFGLIILLFMVATIVLDIVLYKGNDPYEGNKYLIEKQPKEKLKELESRADTELVGNLPPFNDIPREGPAVDSNIIKYEEYKIAAKIKRSDPLRILFLAISYLLFPLYLCTFLPLSINKEAANKVMFGDGPIQLVVFLMTFNVMVVGLILLIISLFKLRGGFSLTKADTSYRKLRQKKTISQLMTAASFFYVIAAIFAAVILFSVGLSFYPATFEQIRWSLSYFGISPDLYLFLFSLSLVTFVYGITVSTRQKTIFQCVSSLSNPVTNLREPMSALKRYMLIADLLKKDKKSSDHLRLEMGKKGKARACFGIVLAALAVVAVLLGTTLPNSGIYTYTTFATISEKDNANSLMARFGAPNITSTYSTGNVFVWVKGPHVDYVADLLEGVTDYPNIWGDAQKLEAVTDKKYDYLAISLDTVGKVNSASLSLDIVLFPSSTDGNGGNNYSYTIDELILGEGQELPVVSEIASTLYDETFEQSKNGELVTWDELETWEKRNALDEAVQEALGNLQFFLRRFDLEGKTATYGDFYGSFYLDSTYRFDGGGTLVSGHCRFDNGNSRTQPIELQMF